MLMEPADIARFVVFSAFGMGTAFMVMTNFIAYLVLRPPQKLGFLWWHILGISIAFLCFGVVAVERVVGRLGYPPTWRLWVMLVGSVSYLAAQTLIFTVERQRLLYKRAQARLDVS